MVDRYTYRVIWSEENRSHIGLCEEFPSLRWVAATSDEAAVGIRRLVSSVFRDIRKTAAALAPHQERTPQRSDSP